MTALVDYRLEDNIAAITLDDGKVNALSPAMIDEINAALDRAEGDGSIVVLTGREGIFSAGFHLPTLQAGGDDARRMLLGGFELGARILAHPRPVVVACTGHAIAMGVFLVLSADYRVGIDGPYRIVANEVAIGLTMPHAAVEICRQRLAPAHFNRAVILAETYTPSDAVAAGFLDRVVQADDLAKVAHETATGLATLNLDAHAATKQRARAIALEAVRAGIEADAAALGLR